jgi:nicotinamidase-related amidase
VVIQEVQMEALLLIVDMQRGFVTPATRNALPPIRALARSWPLSAPVVMSRFHNRPGSSFETLLHWYKLRDEPDTELVPDLDEVANREGTLIVDKFGYTAFTDGVRVVAAGNDITDVVVCGLDTDTCVLKTVVDVFEAGLRPWLASDCCASNGGPSDHESGLHLARRFIGTQQVLPWSEILRFLSIRAISRRGR